MKKVLSLIVICFIIISIMGSVNAAFSCNVDLQMEKTTYAQGDEFTVNVNVSNIQSDRGVISLGATLEYDKDSLTLVKMEGKNGWETPSEGSSYNASNGKIAITRSGLGKNNETIFTITFKVKQGAKRNFDIALKEISLADGTAPYSINKASKNVTIQEATNNPVQKPEEDKNNTLPIIPGNNTNSNNTNNNLPIISNTSNNSVITNQDLPKTGVDDTALVVGIVAVGAGAVISFIRMHNLNRK